MAKLSLVVRQKKRLKLVSQCAPKRAFLKHKMKTAPTLNETFSYGQKLQALPRNGLPVRLKSRCFITGRAKAYYRDFGLCRHKLRELALCGQLPGVIKGSW